MNDIRRYLKGAEGLQDVIASAPKPRVVILGSYNCGKSTLLNNLLGDEISPVGAAPTTSCLLCFDYGSRFNARYAGPGGRKVFDRRDHLHTFLNQLKTPAGRVDIQLPSPFLKKCCLVDTPGLDFLGWDAGRLAEQAISGADKIIYLFHQRGIEDYNRLFLYKLASLWKGKDLNDISFWLNCNLGLCDGTSLESTRAVLREIFIRQVRLNTINTMDRDNVGILRLFLEVELARNSLVYACNTLKRLDGELPGRLKKISGAKDDSMFLREFWQLQETAAKILVSGRLLHSLPPVLQEMDKHLGLMNSANLGETAGAAGGRPYGCSAGSLKEVRDTLLDLVLHLLGEKHLDTLVERKTLQDLYRQIEEERFTIVVTGGFSTGKSTFLNALLKEEIFPAADGPSTVSLTRLTHGPRKRAVVRTPLQVTLKVYEQIGGRACLQREVLAAAERWLSAPTGGLAGLEARVDGRFKSVDRVELSLLIKKSREFFAAGPWAASASPKTAPAAFRPVSLKSLRGGRMLEEIRVTFPNPGSREFDLATPEGVEGFRRATGSGNVFEIEEVEIEHPCRFLELADFVDTPGLDWIQKHHLERTSRLIRRSDSCLVFLNARHILNDMDRENIYSLLTPFAEGLRAEDYRKLFFVINFSDVLNPAQRESVYTFFRENLRSALAQAGPAPPGPGIFMISARKGLSGQDGGMNSLMKNLEEGILRQRGRHFYLNIVSRLNALLEQALQRVSSELLSGVSSYPRKKSLLKARENLRESRRRLKEVRISLHSPGGNG